MSKKKDQNINKIDISEINFNYGGVEVEYSSRKAEDHELRCANDYCRCETIEDIKITSIDSVYITRMIMDKYMMSHNKEKLYSVERVISSLDEDSFYVSVSNGYYGQEIRGVYISDDNVIKFIKDIMKSDKPYESIRLALNYEYGYLLDELKTCNFKKINVKLSDVIFGQNTHYKKLNKEKVALYREMIDKCKGVSESDIYGIVSKNGDKYRLIDGYHRCRAAEEQNVENISVFLVENN